MRSLYWYLSILTISSTCIYFILLFRSTMNSVSCPRPSATSARPSSVCTGTCGIPGPSASCCYSGYTPCSRTSGFSWRTEPPCTCGSASPWTAATSHTSATRPSESWRISRTDKGRSNFMVICRVLWWSGRYNILRICGSEKKALQQKFTRIEG